jgi:N-acetyl sugar amidotransferase
MAEYPRGEKGKNDWKKIVEKMKITGEKKKYDCIVGVSGGTDSSYLLHICKTCGLRVLAVNLDNGWSTEIAVNNIKKITKQLNYDLITYVIDYQEVQAVIRTYLKASFPWADSPTDMAIKAALYRIAKKEKIKYVLNGSDFRTEGKQPFSWTYSDAKQLCFLLKKYENKTIKTFPILTYKQLGWLSIIKGIKMVRPFYFLDYSKQQAQKELIEVYHWEYYGGHHHENIFTKFIIAYWLYEKFGIDKRKITLSAQIMNGDITREEALVIIQQKPYKENDIDNLKHYVFKKLDITESEFEVWFKSPNKFYYDYPNSYKKIFKNLRLITFLSARALLYKPTSLELKKTDKKRDHS